MPRPIPTANASLLDFAGAKAVKQLQQTSDVVAERRRQKRATAAVVSVGATSPADAAPAEALFASRVNRSMVAAAPRRVPGHCPGVGNVRSAQELVAPSAARKLQVDELRQKTRTLAAALPKAENEDGYEISKEQLQRAFEAYSSVLVVDLEEGQSALDSMEEWMTRTRTCCICIELIRREDRIWSCNHCSVPVHLGCVQTWASRFIKYADSQNIKDPEPWTCPNCRHPFKRSEYPSEYTCFCGKEVDPRPNPWLLPHSCGDHCGKELSCGHTCKLICHPGKCPPCPLSVTVACHCGAVSKKKRCGTPAFSCGTTCDKILPCGHKCNRECHSGECGPCTMKVVRKCKCGSKKKLMHCSDADDFRCEKVCGKDLPCGVHKCTAICCEPGKCPPCPTEKTCACGKTTIAIRCRDNATPQVRCEHTCGKLLDCRKHRCTRRCHEGPCGPCTQVTKKTCRCGREPAKEHPCNQEFLCDRKCNKERNCGRHQCNRRCCDGNCPPCTVPCGRKLDCGSCRCTLVCGHSGFDSLGCELYNCPPCTKQTEVRCFCGETAVMVPCGLPKKPPHCLEWCKIPPTCHHETRTPHRCHTGPCPPCDQVCNRTRECGHSCLHLCHDKVPEIDFSSAAWSRRPRDKSLLDVLGALMPTRQTFDTMVCPPCTEKVDRVCLGGHAAFQVQCVSDPYFSCGAPCGNLLPCGNHRCQKECHAVLSRRSPEEFLALLDADDATGSKDETGHQIEADVANKTETDALCNSPDATAIIEKGPEQHESLQGWVSSASWHSSNICPPVTPKMHTNRGPEQFDCGECNLPCMRPRPAGCKHKCPWPCHFEPCPPCFEDTQVRCYCGQTLLTYACCEVLSWPSDASNEVENPFLRCPFTCHKKYEKCPHMCSAKCHFGPCPPCEKDVLVRCRCGNVKQHLPCAKAWPDGKQLFLECVEECKAAAAAAAAAAKEEDASAAKENEEPQEQLSPSELRERKRDKRRQREEEMEEKRKQADRLKQRKVLVRRAKVAGIVILIIVFIGVFVAIIAQERNANLMEVETKIKRRPASRDL